jgi:hypothetical protein
MNFENLPALPKIRRKTWNDAETEALMTIWYSDRFLRRQKKAHVSQAKFKHTLYKAAAHIFRIKTGIHITFNQVKEKIRNMEALYKTRSPPSGDNPNDSYWLWWSRVKNGDYIPDPLCNEPCPEISDEELFCSLHDDSDEDITPQSTPLLQPQRHQLQLHPPPQPQTQPVSRSDVGQFLAKYGDLQKYLRLFHDDGEPEQKVLQEKLRAQGVTNLRGVFFMDENQLYALQPHLQNMIKASWKLKLE